MKYLILIHSNPTSRAAWEGLSHQQKVESGRAHLALTEELAASGELIVSEGLADQALAKRVSVRDGKVLHTDGPFAEVKEYLAGFYLIECDSIDRALEHAAKLPDAVLNEVEVRPVLDLSGLEM
ncbi:YciI family protein [Amycolatopsis anabasis]|uniref:YciI family protein n=1 Tax=Amycolatopsis anabasis TaxID=1840409 RepID=UPI00131DDEC8|nr:YciI family protein [Amycolatopsis anabasis]